MLTADEEEHLSLDLHQNGNLDSAKKLVMSHLRFVLKIARGYSGYGLAQEDLIQEGNIGLMKAVKRFDPHVGVRLASFAIHWVRAEIHEFVLRNWRIVKIATTKAQRKLFFKLRQACSDIGSNLNKQLSLTDANLIAEELDVPTKSVHEMQTRLMNFDLSLLHDEYQPSSNEQTAAPLQLEDQRYSPELQVEQKQWGDTQERSLYQALAAIDERSQTIIQQRWLNTSEKKATLHQLAKRFGVSAERIRQLEKQALQKLKSILGADANQLFQ